MTFSSANNCSRLAGGVDEEGGGTGGWNIP
jgi:hypothetical protein